jgi:tripartite-type tricarboxylate transporter receptor subunit TctC
MQRRAFLKLLAAHAAVSAVPGGAFAQAEYPTRQIEFVIPLPPGGPTDAAPRIALTHMQPLLKVPLVPVNKPGAGGGIAAEYVAKSRPDGYTVFATSNPTLSVKTAIEQGLPFGMNDFIPIGMYASDVGVLAARKGIGLDSVEALIDYARKNPGKLSYASAGVGSVSHFSAELFKQAAGVDILHVPYPGSGPARAAILGGHVPVVSAAYSAFAALFQSGDLVPLITTSPKRLAALPDVPTLADRGLGTSSLNIWMGFYVPVKTPDAVVAALSAALAAAVKDPAMIAAIEKGGMLMDYRDGAATRRLLEQEHATVRKAAEKIDFKKS